MGIIADAEGWLFKVAAKKVIVKAVSMLTAWIVSGFIAGALAQAGVTVDPIRFQAYMTGLAMIAVKGAEDYLNLRYGTNF